MTSKSRLFLVTSLSAFAVTSAAILLFKPALARAALIGPPVAEQHDRANDERQSDDGSRSGSADEDQTARRKTVAVDPIRSLEQRGEPGAFRFLGIAGASFAPKSPFSNKLKANDFKQIEVSYDQGRFFAGTLNGIGFRFLNSANYSADIAVDDDSGVQLAKLNGDYRIYGPFVISASANFGLSDREGNTFDFGLGIEQPLTTKLEVSVSGDVTYADGRHLRKLAGQLADAGGPGPGELPFKVGAGFQSYSISATLAYELTSSLTVIAAAGGVGALGDTRRLLNLVDRTKRFQPAGLLVLAYSF